MQVAFYFAGGITQVLDAIPWVRCASGNVLFTSSLLFIDISDRLLFLEIITIKSTGFVQLSEWLLNFEGKFMFFGSSKKTKHKMDYL